MNQQYNDTHKYGYLLSEIYGKKLSLFTEDDYNTLKQCENAEELSIKLIKNYKYISEDMEFTKTDLKRILIKTLIEEYNKCLLTNDNTLSIVLNYYIDTHKIHNFFFLLQSKVKDCDLTKSFNKIIIGDFDALKTLKFCKDMTDVKKFCVENCFLKEYFYNIKWEIEFSDNNFQVQQALFYKYYIENTYNKLIKSTKGSFMEEILKQESDKYIIDLTYNTLNNKEVKRISLYPKVFSFDMKTLYNLSTCESVEEIRKVENNMKKISDTYLESFKLFNDISCVYSYFKLKEQEIKNILWILDCISQGRREEIDKLLVR